jgi:hypothetical protein
MNIQTARIDDDPSFAYIDIAYCVINLCFVSHVSNTNTHFDFHFEDFSFANCDVMPVYLYIGNSTHPGK